MANEITTAGALKYLDAAGATGVLDIPPLTANAAGLAYTQMSQLIFTTQTPLNLGAVATLGWVLIQNIDPTNYIGLYTSTTGVEFARMYPGEFAHFRFGAGVTAPSLLANTANARIDYLLCDL